MVPRMLTQIIKPPWTYIGLFSILAALIAGFAYGLAQPVGVVAEQPTPILRSESGAAWTPTPIPTPLVIATPEPGEVIPLIPVTVTYEYVGAGAMGKSSDSLVFSPSNRGDRQVNLRDGTSIPLPDNVHIVEVIRMGQCGQTPCPVLPAYVLAMGEVEMGVDSEGSVYPTNPEVDMNAWGFLSEREKLK